MDPFPRSRLQDKMVWWSGNPFKKPFLTRSLRKPFQTTLSFKVLRPVVKAFFKGCSSFFKVLFKRIPILL